MPALSRTRLFGFIFLLLSLNALPTFIGEAVQSHGWLVATLDLFDVSAIVWLALAAGVTMAWQSGSTSDESATLASRADLALAFGATLIALVPVPPLSAGALSGVALWCWTTSRPGSSARRSAAVFLSLSTFFFWGRIFLALGAGPLLSADAHFVSLISGMAVEGNVVSFINGNRFLIAPGCSSLHGISLALILWTTAIAWFKLPVTRSLIYILVIAVLASVAVNGLRLTMIAWHPDQFSYWHVGMGASLFGWLALFADLGVVYYGIQSALR
ncbi:MAG: hypothetical protein ABIW31_08625 [Novosphingobium sp.]